MRSSEELQTTLASVAVDWPAEVDVHDQVLQRISVSQVTPTVARRQVRLSRVVLAAVALLTAVGIVLAMPGPRGAVARLLGFPGITVERTTEPLPELSGIDLGTAVPLVEAERSFDVRTLPLPEHGVFLDEASGAVHIVYRLASGEPMLLTQLQGGDDPYLAKRAPDVIPTEVGGEFALWVTGKQHAVLTAGRRRDEARLSDNALLWAADGVTYRLEADISVGQAVDLAERLR